MAQFWLRVNATSLQGHDAPPSLARWGLSQRERNSPADSGRHASVFPHTHCDDHCYYVTPYKSALRKTDSKYKHPFASSTINRYLQVLSRVLSMAYENGIIDSNPMERVNRLRELETRERFLNQYAEDEEERLINALVAYGEHLVALVELDLEVGMRLGELLNATWSNVVGDVIFVMKTKNDKPRAIPLTKRTLEILRGLRQDAPADERIFDPKRTGRKRRQLMACFQAAVQAGGLTDFHFHDFRHTFATRLRAANVHPYDIADLLGSFSP